MKKIMTRIGKTVLFYVLLISIWYLLWEILVKRYNVVSGAIFASPLDVLKAMGGLLFRNDNQFWNHMEMSLLRLIIGYVASVLVGVILALMMIFGKFFSNELRALLSGLQSLPNICWVPLAIIFCGIDEKSVYFVIILGSSPSVALAIASSIANIDPIFIRAGKTLGCNKIGMINRIYIPAALPSIVSGLRQGWAFSWRALMAGEMQCLFSAGAFGAGYLMDKLREAGLIDKVICIMIILILIGVFFEKAVFGLLEKRILSVRGIGRENE